MLETVIINKLKKKLLDSGIELERIYDLSSEREFSPSVVAIVSLDSNGEIAITNLVNGMIVNGVALLIDDMAVIVDMGLRDSL